MPPAPRVFSSFIRMDEDEEKSTSGFQLTNRGFAMLTTPKSLRRGCLLLAVLALLISFFAGRVCVHILPPDRKYRPLRIVGIMLSAGALGNMIDRIWHHYVIDFLYFSLIRFPVFNVADIYVCVSCGALLILVLFFYKEEDLQFRH